MKKMMVLGAAMCVALSFTGCKSSESAYKKAYEKAKAQEQTSTDNDDSMKQDAPVVAPVETVQQPVNQAPVVDNYDNEPVRRENVAVVNGAGLKAYSVVVGSFGVKANAEGLQQRLQNAGYSAQVAFNSGNNMYRVVAATFDSKASAVQSRNQLRATYADAWLLAKYMGRILAIDYGKKRTGLAVTDPLRIIANGLATIPTSDIFDYLTQYVAKESVDQLVIGKPIQPNGQPSENLARVENFVNRWRKLHPEMPIDYYDERFTSVIAHQAMIAGGVKKKTRREDKGLVDEISATIILQDYMRSKGL